MVKSKKVRGVLAVERRITALEARIAKRRAPYDEKISAIQVKRDAVIEKNVARLAKLKADRVLKLGNLNGTQSGELARVRREGGSP